MINENYIVSVPYRGYSFFNHFTLRIFGTCLFNIVSVPYRGYSFFNEQLCQAFREWLKTPFPSLTGVIRFLITEFIHVATAQDNVSVPYRGYSFFNCRRCAYISVVWFVSVPYRGYSFFNYVPFAFKYTTARKVSVPYRGYSFFNKWILKNSKT